VTIRQTNAHTPSGKQGRKKTKPNVREAQDKTKDIDTPPTTNRKRGPRKQKRKSREMKKKKKPPAVKPP